MKNRIRKNLFLRNIQLVSFILLSIFALALIWFIIKDQLPIYCIICLFPIAIMIKINTKNWDKYDMIVILLRCFSNKNYRENFLKKMEEGEEKEEEETPKSEEEIS